MRNQTINLNLIPGGVMPVVHLSQFDQDVDGSLIFNIYNGPVPYDLTDCVAHIQGHKPDGTAFDYQCTVHETYVTAATEYQMTVVAGQYQAEMRISKDGSAVGTVNLVFSVEPSTMTDVDLSHTDIPDLMLEIEQAVVSSGASASASEDSAEDSEAWAVGQRDGQDVPDTDPTYHNNAKYYAENAGQGVEDAEAWAIGERGGVPVTSGDPTYENNSKYYSEESEGSAEDSEAWAVGERNGTPVTSGDPTYQNNSEYWKDQAEGQAENAEAWAVGERGGTPVTSGDPTYENNAEYYAGEASSSATAAGTSETNAATSEDNAEAWATGQKNGSDVPSGDPAYHNNSKYYSEQADDSAEDAEAWAVGERDGVPVDPSDPTYHNNAKYYSEQMGLPSLAGLTDVELTSLADDDILQYDSNSSKWVNVSGSGLQPGDMTGATALDPGTHGLVPAPAAGDQDKVLNGDGTWKNLPAMTGATSLLAGTSGLVPAPAAGDEDKVLKGDGTWGNAPGDVPQSMIGDAWVSGHAYAVGDYCIDGNVLYKCKTAHTSTASNRPPYASYWDAVSVASELQAIRNKLILPHLFYRGYSNTAMGSMTGISGHSGKSLSVVDDYLTGGNAGNAWYGTYFSNPVNLSDCNRIYVEIENTAIMDSSTSAMYQLVLFNTTPVWNGGYAASVFMDRQGDPYAINYSQGTHIFCKDLSSFSASQKANTYVGIGFIGNSTNSHIKQIWVA